MSTNANMPFRGTTRPMLNNPTCSICFELRTPSNITIISNHNVCHTCIQQLFQNAIDDESEYPPKLGDVILRANQYHHALPFTLRAKFSMKENEWSVPPTDRVYCGCGGFVGERAAPRITAECAHCEAPCCVACGQDVTGQNLAFHICPPPVDDEVAFAGLVRGKDYQICPNGGCKRKVQIWDGCNHLVCVCRTEFCFVCGEVARGGSNHWRDCCPRYGHERGENARFDPGRVTGQRRAGAPARTGFGNAGRGNEGGGRRNAIAGQGGAGGAVAARAFWEDGDDDMLLSDGEDDM